MGSSCTEGQGALAIAPPVMHELYQAYSCPPGTYNDMVTTTRSLPCRHCAPHAAPWSSVKAHRSEPIRRRCAANSLFISLFWFPNLDCLSQKEWVTDNSCVTSGRPPRP